MYGEKTEACRGISQHPDTQIYYSTYSCLKCGQFFGGQFFSWAEFYIVLKMVSPPFIFKPEILHQI